MYSNKQKPIMDYKVVETKFNAQLAVLINIVTLGKFFQ